VLRIFWDFDDVRNDPPKASEIEAFALLKSRQRRSWQMFGVPFLGGLLSALVIGYVDEGIGRVLAVVTVLIGVPCMAYFVYLTAKLKGARCPRCGEECFVTGLYRNDFARRCLNCQVLLYWPDDMLTKRSNEQNA
jgi:hypothetical protein